MECKLGKVCHTLAGLVTVAVAVLTITVMVLGYQVRFMSLDVVDDLKILGPKALIPLALIVILLMISHLLDQPYLTLKEARLKQRIGTFLAPFVVGGAAFCIWRNIQEIRYFAGVHLLTRFVLMQTEPQHLWLLYNDLVVMAAMFIVIMLLQSDEQVQWSTKPG